jgi:hypothetical protein
MRGGGFIGLGVFRFHLTQQHVTATTVTIHCQYVILQSMFFFMVLVGICHVARGATFATH